MSFRYAICNETYQDWPHERVCAAVAATGYTGLELAPFTLCSARITDLSASRRAEIRGQAEAHGLTIVGLHWLLAKTDGFMITSPDVGGAQADRPLPRRAGALLPRLRRRVARARLADATADSSRSDTGSGGRNALDCLRYAFPELERQRVYLCLEPLAPSETDFMQTAAEGKGLMDRLANPWVRLHLDVKAMSSEAKPVPEVIREFAPWMKHFHANDANRRGPGFGQTDFVPIFQALKDVNYGGWVSVEVFDYSPDPETIARESLRHMRECETKTITPRSG